MKLKLKTWINILFVVVFFLILLIGLGRTVLLPKDFNVYENRYANKLLNLSFAATMDGSFQFATENALNDQIPLAQHMKKGYNLVVKNALNPMVSAILQCSNTYIRYFGLNLFGEHIVYTCDNFEYIKESLDNRAKNYNTLILENPNLEFYAFYIEKDTEIDFVTNKKNPSAAYVLSQLYIPEANWDIFEINSYVDFSRYFFKTDHHWNHRGAYRGYQQLVDLLCVEEPPLMYDDEIIAFENFKGSKGIKVGSSLVVDRFYAYTFSFPQYSILENGAEVVDYGRQSDYLIGEGVFYYSYGDFYGSDSGEIVFDTGRVDRDNILVIGESFDNAILKLLASHFNRTYSIDLRNYEYFMGKKFDFNQYVIDNNIDKVLFIGNSGFWTSTDFIMESY